MIRNAVEAFNFIMIEGANQRRIDKDIVVRWRSRPHSKFQIGKQSIKVSTAPSPKVEKPQKIKTPVRKVEREVRRDDASRIMGYINRPEFNVYVYESSFNKEQRTRLDVSVMSSVDNQVVDRVRLGVYIRYRGTVIYKFESAPIMTDEFIRHFNQFSLQSRAFEIIKYLLKDFELDLVNSTCIITSENILTLLAYARDKIKSIEKGIRNSSIPPSRTYSMDARL